jgi:hypothetical protein
MGIEEFKPYDEDEIANCIEVDPLSLIGNLKNEKIWRGLYVEINTYV